MSEKDNTSLTAQGAVLQYLPTIIDQLKHVFSPFQLAQLLVDFVQNIGFKNSSNERLIESRIKCINKIIEEWGAERDRSKYNFEINKNKIFKISK